MPPSRIYLLRHAEKPDGETMGVLPSGEANQKSLSVRGWQRAGALASHFASTLTEESPSQFLFASHSSSLRPRFTLLPLSEKLGVAINTQFGKGEEEELAQSARACDGVVLIAWQHDFMAAAANAILLNNRIAPQAWPANRFDITWVFDFDPSAGNYRFRQIPQLLLAGDLLEPIPLSQSGGT